MKKKDDKSSSKKVGKMAALKGLHKMASDMMGADMAGLKKVTVMAKNKKGLKEGLEKAEEIIDPSEESEMESEHSDSMESNELKKLLAKKKSK